MWPLAVRKLAFLGFTIPSTILLLPIWTLSALPASLRPDPHGPLSRAISTYLTRHLIRCLVLFRVPGLSANTRSPPSHADNIKRKRGPFVLIPHIGAEQLSGPLALEKEAGKGTFETGLLTLEMQKEPFGAFWYPASPSLEVRGPSSKLILYFHGGAYVSFSAGETDFETAARRISTTTDTDVLTVEYTLAAEDDPSTRFPRILYEAYCAYKYVTTDLGYAPPSVFLSGDSAGGNLAVTLAHYIVTYDVPLPGGLILYSPWTDMTFTSDSLTRNAATDNIMASYPKWGFSALTQDHPLLKKSATSPWLSPIFITPEHAAKFPRTYISAGGHETLLDEIRLLRDLLQGAQVDVTYDESPCMPHDFQLLGAFEVEAKGLNTRIKAWLQQA